MNTPIFRKITLQAYKPGRSFLNKKKKIIKLSANESALGMSKNAQRVIKKASDNISKYPDGKFKDLTSMISKKYNCNQNQVICGSGSDEIIQMLCQLFLNKGDEVVVPEFSFLMYRIYAQIVGAKVVFSKEKNFKVSNNEIFKKVSKKTKIVFLANPNNPTGTYISKNQLLDLRKRLNNIYVAHTGQDFQVIEEAVERDRYMSPEEAKEFGLIDEVVDKRPELEEEVSDKSSDEDNNAD